MVYKGIGDNIMHNINFIYRRNLWYILSLIVIGVGIFFMISNKINKGSAFNWGIDFTGGTVLNIRLNDKLAEINSSESQKNKILKEIKTVVVENGHEEVSVRYIDKSDILMRTRVLSLYGKDKLLKAIEAKFGKIEVLQADTIGPSVGADLRTTSIWITLVTLVLLTIYITFRFEFWFAISAILALIHDVLITIGFAAIFRIEVDTAFVAAILTILGYSINDTIVIFDRIRENLKKHKDDMKLDEIANVSVNQTLARSINTVMTVLITLAMIILFGGASLQSFAIVLFVGIFSGCFSSIFVASPLMVDFKSRLAK